MQVEYIKQEQIFSLEIESGFVIAGDIHLYNHYPYSSPNSHSFYSQRLGDIAKALHWCGVAAKNLGIPLILNGDILHTGSFDFATLSALTTFLKTYQDIDIYINTGNHDLESGHSMIQPLVQFSGCTKHLVITYPMASPLINSSKHYFVFMPYMSKEETLDKLKNTNVPKGQKLVLIIHNTFASSRFANNAISASGISPNLSIFKKFDLVVASDVHKYQTIMNGRGFYTSSLIPLNFGERTKEHGFHIIDLKKDVRYFVIPEAPRFKQLALSHLKSLTKTQLKSNVRGNIIKVIDDSPFGSKPLNKEEFRDQLISNGAIFVAFSTTKYGKTEVRSPVIKTSESKVSIVTNYSKRLAKEYGLNRARAEEIGIKILKAAEIKSSKEKEEK